MPCAHHFGSRPACGRSHGRSGQTERCWRDRARCLVGQSTKGTPRFQRRPNKTSCLPRTLELPANRPCQESGALETHSLESRKTPLPDRPIAGAEEESGGSGRPLAFHGSQWEKWGGERRAGCPGFRVADGSCKRPAGSFFFAPSRAHGRGSCIHSQSDAVQPWTSGHDSHWPLIGREYWKHQIFLNGHLHTKE